MPTSKNFSASKLNERGIAQILILLILVAGLIGGLILIKNPTVFKPKASESSPIYPPPTPTACNARIASIYLLEPCNEIKNGFRTMKYSCSIGEVPQQPPACRSMEDWARTAFKGCSSLCPVPTPTPTPCQPKPACLDASPACLMPEPAGGWCPGVSPTPFPTPVQVSYCKIMNNKINASFGTTCGDSGYDPVADVNKDRSVTILDFSTVNNSSEEACKRMNNDTINPCLIPNP